MEWDLVIIGAGPGGYNAAIRAAQHRAKVCLIEKNAVGGVCLNDGCIPTKTLAAAAEYVTGAIRAADYGINIGQARTDWPKILQRKDEVVTRLAGGLHRLLTKNGVHQIHGTARFLSPHKLIVDDNTEIQAKKVIIATGTEAFVPPVFGHDGEAVITSDEAVLMAKLPAAMAIIGGGVIGCEFASILHALGVEITLVEQNPGLLPALDEELGRHLRVSFQKRGIRVLTGQGVEKITKGKNGVGLRLSGGGVIEIERVLVAVGRKPNSTGMELAKAGLAVDEQGRIPVGPDLQTKVAGIYAIGDINNLGPELAHVASRQGLAVADSLFTPHPRFFEDNAVPNCIFTDPEIATVGLTRDEAQHQGLQTQVSKTSYLANGRALAMGETEGWVKIVANADDGRILGVHIFGARASDLIAEATLAVRYGITAVQLAETIHAHPTLAETIMEAAQGLRGSGIYM